MRVVAVDPGTRSGISWCMIRGKRWTRDEVVHSWGAGTGGTCEVTGPTEPHRAFAIIEKVSELKADVLVIEDFVLYPGVSHGVQRSGTEPMRLIAMLDFAWFMARMDDEEAWLPEVVKQMASERVGVTVEELKRLGLYRTRGQGGGKDSTAATQHLLTYIKKVNAGMRKDR